MKILNRGLVSLMALVSMSTGANAEIKLSPVFSDDMVLQQNAVVRVHGTAVADSKVKVSVPWLHKPVETRSDNTGSWSLELPTPGYGGPYEITVGDKDGTLTLGNVLVGDVWVCGGQSNMEMPMRGFSGQPVYGTVDMIVKADSGRNLRLYKQPRDWSTTPKTDVDSGRWAVESPLTVGDFSAVGYIFGNYVQNVLDIPVGLIQCCWSNSKIEAWMPREVFESKFQDAELPAVGQTEFGWLEGTPTLLYNAMVNPWDGFPVKGVVWYQGEANNPYPEMYKKLFPECVKEWQRVFRNDSMPFYYVQLAPYNAGDGRAFNYAEFRQAQAELLDMVPNVGMAATGDLGDSIFIHAPKKMKVGERLAYLALEQTYGRVGADVKVPIARACGFNPDEKTIWITFDNQGLGLIPTQCELSGFEVVDADGNIHDAVAKTYGGNGVAVWSPVDNPVEVRYGFRNYYEASLFNNMYIPASPFKMSVPK